MSDAWGSWTLGYDGTVLCHDGGYGVELERVNGASDIEWWMEHLRGKGWATDQVVADFRSAVTELVAK